MLTGKRELHRGSMGAGQQEKQLNPVATSPTHQVCAGDSGLLGTTALKFYI